MPFRRHTDPAKGPFPAVLAIGALSAVLAFTAGPAATAQDRPNVVMFIMDDLGYGDIGSYGAPDATTPNIDRLAREGVKLTDFYANHANCSPTRTGFITGRYQQRYGIESPLAFANETRELPPSETSLPRLLKSVGYATALIGKWHLGSRREVSPNRHGFDEFWGFLHGAADYYSHGWTLPGRGGSPTSPAAGGTAGRFQPDLYHNEEPTTSSGYLTDEFTTHAEAFIKEHAAGPFFVEVAYNATHWPFQRPDLPEGRRAWRDAIQDGTRADYVAMLERADQGVGRVLALLDRLQLAQNTLVIFTSDNGGEWLSRNAPLFHRKSTLWEGGIRVPLLLRWPARLKAGVASPQVGITMDLTASIIAAAGVTPPASYRPEGIDLIGPLQKGSVIERTLFWRLPVAPGAPPVTQRAVRRGNWKYVDDRGQYLLFDVRNDPGERHDVAQEHREVVRELRALVANWEADVNAEAKQRAASPTSSDVAITASIHSSIQLEYGGKVIQIDPWSAGNLAALKPADLILITDDVNHHLDVKAIQQLRKPGTPVVIAANGRKQVPDGIVMNNGETREVAGFKIEATAAYDVTPGVSFHPKGEANGYIITLGGPPSLAANANASSATGKRIYVVGVTECVPEVRAAKDIDIAFFPMNLPAARMEPAAAIECIKAFRPKVVYPYHYDQDWVTRVNRGQPRGSATTRGLQELKDGLQTAGIEVRLADWYPQ
jgi:arylsulfatase A-like enzyme/L-ascorbate metabolism protein UlaG (beta-lactamase superfamily)